MPIISYAQNFEDIMLWRALRLVSKGFYIDVGAQHPRIDSVSRLFYEHGWRGMHIEAQLRYALMLQEDRPDEIVLPVALSDRSGVMVFYEVPIGGGGLSTGDAAVAEVHRVQNHLEVHDIITPTLTLDDVFLQVGPREIHWMKIDVEGMEGQVLDGWKTETVRPWILVIESTFPMTETPTHGSWEQKVLDRGYCHAYWDGLNRFYVSTDHPELLEHLRTPPNVFDDFTLSGLSNAPFCAHLRSEHLNLITELKAADERAKLLLEESNRGLAAHSQDVEAENRRLGLEKVATDRERALLQRLADQETSSAAQQLETANRELQQEKTATERGRELLQRLADLEASNAARLLEAANRQHELEQLAASRERELLQRLADQEASTAARLVHAANQQLELEQLAAERERDLMQRLAEQERDTRWQREVARQKARATKHKFRRRKRAMAQQLQDSDIEIIQLRSGMANAQAELIRLRGHEAELREELVQLQGSHLARRPWLLIVRAVTAASAWLRPATLSTSPTPRVK